MTALLGADQLSPADEDAFRQRCRAFLDANATKRARTAKPADDDAAAAPELDDEAELARTKAYQRALFDAGLAGLAYPKEYGGQGLTLRHEEIWREVAGEYELPTRLLAISHGMCLPVMAQFGTDEQKKAHLEKLISAEEVWAQMFSEPGAGSDVASLQSKAVRDGDEWVLNGQKVWTTYAHVCDKGLVVARTDPEQPKHAGLSMFLVDLKAPGVLVRPLKQLTGKAEFNEVFFTDVRLPADALVGPLNDGWRVATAMLMYERVSIGSGDAGEVRHDAADSLIRMAQKQGRSADPVVRQALAKLYSDEVAKSLISLRTQAEQESGKAPGPGGSLGKLFGAIISRSVRDLTFSLLGTEATGWQQEATGRAVERALMSLAASIAGGTDEIQKNIIGERVLGLPREPSVDKGVPFKDLLVSKASK